MLGPSYLIGIPFLFLFLIVFLFFNKKNKELKKNFENELEAKYKQLEILSSFYSVLGIEKSLPATGGWAASPDFLQKISEVILQREPGVVVEASSGISSLIIGYCFKKIGKGKVISLEHDILYVEKSKKMILDHNLEKYVEVIHAPLIEYDIKGKKWLWYDINSLKNVSEIDMVVVDGPPYYVQEFSRYPVIPLLYDVMSNDSVLVIDDGNRKEEKEIIKRWDKEYEYISSEFFSFETGAFLVKKDKGDKKDKTLLAFTTANQLEYNIRGVRSIIENKPDYVDLVVFDDASNDGTVEWCKDNAISIVTKEQSKGLTNSWNLAYAKFKQENYKHLIFANNDIIVPKNAIHQLISQNDEYAIVSALSTKKGVGHQKLQDIRKYYDFDFDEYDYTNTQIVQNFIDNASLPEKIKDIEYINGFFFSINRSIIAYEYSENQLFNPKSVNVGNEDELCQKVKEPIGVVLNSYIFHFKGVSLEIYNPDNLSFDYNIYRDFNWQKVNELKNSTLKNRWFKIKNRFSS